MNLKVHAGYPGNPFFCASCCTKKDTGRAYDLNVWLETPKGYVNGTITLCESCRTDFHYADLELDAPAMEAEYLRRQNEPIPLVSEEAVDYLELGSRLRPAKHLTFPRGGHHE